jgi:hypothetical protein
MWYIKKVCSNFDRVFSLLTLTFTCQKRILISQIRIPALGTYFLGSVDLASLYYLVNKTNLAHNCILAVFINLYMFRVTMGCLVCRVPPCIPDSHPHRITSTKRCINTVVFPDDGPIVVRNM